MARRREEGRKTHVFSRRNKCTCATKKKIRGATTLLNELNPLHDLIGVVPSAVEVEGLALAALTTPPLLVGALDGLCRGFLAEWRSA
jgi:hypothetical protein